MSHNESLSRDEADERGGNHTSNASQKWCDNNFYQFLEKKNWPANSPDLNPLDFYF